MYVPLRVPTTGPSRRAFRHAGLRSARRFYSRVFRDESEFVRRRFIYDNKVARHRRRRRINWITTRSPRQQLPSARKKRANRRARGGGGDFFIRFPERSRSLSESETNSSVDQWWL